MTVPGDDGVRQTGVTLTWRAAGEHGALLCSLSFPLSAEAEVDGEQERDQSGQVSRPLTDWAGGQSSAKTRVYRT